MSAQLSAAELAEDVGAPRGRRGARQQRGRDRLTGHQRLKRREVLLGERLGRRHQRGLVAVLDGPQHRGERDDRLAGADLAHQEPLHRPRLGEVGATRVDRALLVAGRRERQDRPSQRATSPSPSPSSAVGGDRVAAVKAPAQQVELHEQQLLEGQPAAPALEVAGMGGAAARRRGRAAGGARAGGRAAARARRARRQVLLDEREDLRRREAVRRRVVGHRRRRADALGSSGRAR